MGVIRPDGTVFIKEAESEAGCSRNVQPEALGMKLQKKGERVRSVVAGVVVFAMENLRGVEIMKKQKGVGRKMEEGERRETNEDEANVS